MLDVIVKLFRNGVIVNKNRPGRESGGAAAALGRAVLGTMKLGGM